MNPNLSHDANTFQISGPVPDDRELLAAVSLFRGLSAEELLALRDLLKSRTDMADAAHLRMVYEGVS